MHSPPPPDRHPTAGPDPAADPNSAAPAVPHDAAALQNHGWRRNIVVRQVAVLVLIAALVAIAYVGNRALRHMGPPERCWEYEERDGKLYKVNPCTGQFQLIGDVVAPAQPGR